MNNFECIKKTENGDIMLSTVAFSVSSTAINWFIEILKGNMDDLDHECNGKEYRVYNDSSNNLILEEKRKGNFINDFVFSKKDSQIILEKINSFIEVN